MDLHLTQATVKDDCTVVSTVPYVEECNKVRQPDQCFVYLEAPTGGFVEAEVWCDSYDQLKVGQEFTDGTHVVGSYCAYKDENGRWRTVSGADDCADYAN